MRRCRKTILQGSKKYDFIIDKIHVDIDSKGLMKKWKLKSLYVMMRT